MSISNGAQSEQARDVSEIVSAATHRRPGAPALSSSDVEIMLEVAREEARAGLREGGIPIGAALFHTDGTLLGSGRNRRIQDDDPSVHAETSAFRAAGRRPSYADTILVTTLSPCWYCSGLTRQFGIGTLIVAEAKSFVGQHEWLASEAGVAVTVIDDPECRSLMNTFIAANPAAWLEDIGASL